MWRCYKPYGCFYIGKPWSGENRPVSTFPARPDSIDPRYFLYTRENSEQYHELKIDYFETIRDAPLKKKNNLYFVIHGFLENGDKTWVMVSTSRCTCKFPAAMHHLDTSHSSRGRSISQSFERCDEKL